MKLINSTLIGYAFIGLIGCSSGAATGGGETDTTEYVYKGFHYAVKETARPGGSSFVPYDEITKRLYICIDGKWKEQAESGIKFLETHGRYIANGSVSDDVSDGDKCYKYPKTPKKDKTTARIVMDGGNAVVEITGIDGFEGGD